MEQQRSFVGTNTLTVLLLGVLLLSAGCASGPQSVAAAKKSNEVCYEAYGSPVNKDGIMNVKHLMISIDWSLDEEELSLKVGEPAAAFSECLWSDDGIMGWCDIWAIEPDRVLGDPHIDGLGHEALHGFWGPDWHE